MAQKAYIKTFGCQMNVHDSEKMAGLLREQGYEITGDRDEADVIIFNTCSIREKAEQKFFSDLGKLRRAKSEKPSLKIAVAGCVAQQMGEGLRKRAPHVDIILGPQSIHSVAGMLEGGTNVALEETADVARLELPALRAQGPLAWVNIMYGCNNFCTYCIVPHTRGRERSRPLGNIVAEAHDLAGRGYKEITLLGQNVNSYSAETDFPGLLHELAKIDGIERIRFTTNHPRDLSQGMIDAMGDIDKVCEHIHLPLQSGSSRVLRAMNRKYSYEEYLDKVQRLRQSVPGIAITSDIIAGFPGETDDDHEATVAALREIRFDGLFSFKFSPRPGTRAASMDGQLLEEVKLRRLQEIQALQDEITLSINQALVGREFDVLVEAVDESPHGKLISRTRSHKIVNLAGGPSMVGSIVRVRITEGNMHSLSAEPVGG